MTATPIELPEEEALAILRHGEVVGGQRILWSSNSTFFVHIDAGQGKFLPAIYKPRNGERPLSDFPDGTLYKREYAAFLISRSLGWPNIPMTVIRDGPQGLGAMQLYVNSDPRINYFDLIDGHFDQFMGFAAFDLLTNNADRKGGHCLQDSEGKIWSVDHGLTFHSEFKLRTIMLEFWGKELPKPIVTDIEAFSVQISAKRKSDCNHLNNLLSQQEMDALLQRADSILANPTIPKLDPRYNIPWPLE